MSHHSYFGMNDKNFNDMIKDLGLGATNKFPNGMIDEKDKGQIKMGVTVKDDKIIVAFGTPIEWVGFTRQEAEDFANTILQRARQL